MKWRRGTTPTSSWASGRKMVLPCFCWAPQIDRGSTSQHFHLDSGARLSFGLTLREVERGSQVVSYRYQFVFPDGQSPQYLRFDLLEVPHTLTRSLNRVATCIRESMTYVYPFPYIILSRFSTGFFSYWRGRHTGAGSSRRHLVV